ncbi:TetR/AcrR family transcriptional regulator [Methylobacterium soli]|uniref:TetR/AcrR family transcriptional regulator n=1 Tax=Methylobacterium soli TaxID=553447 RepID=A0A6L3T5D4_9HYPH|nr:TetR family transcriptional regulator [Methylobacterium soli]KAB1080288.1 TetR/AcrR family transcriptional regulator [Methylobacterium soli]GJE44738.1 HTH-type transcriptional regulator BetI [Methylobacterium soli]
MASDAAATARKPGRPKDGPELADVILDKAELAFAEHGFAGTRVRDIAAMAGVNQALIRYYFGTKEDLFDKVFRRRGSLISGARHVLLDRLLAQGKPAKVSEIVMAYLRPQWDMKHSGPNGAAFVRLQARLHAEPEEHAIRLRREVYDDSVKRYVQALSEAMPRIPRETIGMRMAFLVGAYLFMLNDVGRLNDMTDGQIGMIGRDEMLDQLVRFLAAGLCAPTG